MKCPKCQHENPETKKFCRKSGAKLLLACPQCGAEILPDDDFCGECGQKLDEAAEKEVTAREAEGERKYVTALFSDLCGYTAMSEKLDPEEVKEITSRIFGEIAQVITKYEGFVEKFVGDAVMAVFGVPRAHEDDVIRTIRAAREIHELVDAMSPEIEIRIGQSISMHTGINTGLVVTGEVDLKKGTHGIAGDAINLASRLSGLAKAGEILVGPDTYRQAEGHFAFESLELIAVKGKAEPVHVYKVLSAKERPVTIHRLSGLRADLVGRKVELAELREAVENLQKGKGRIFSICGDAGTGKSRLVEEFKTTLDLEKIQWLEGHAYAYAQNIPYFPMIDLLNRVFQIEEADSPERVREKIESGIENLVGKTEDVVPYVGGLFSLSYPEIEEVSPEFWKSRLRDVVQMMLSALALRAPTIFLLEDLHWADPSFVELLGHILLEVRQPAIVLCVHRPAFSLFTTHQLRSIAKVYQEIRLQDLSPSEAEGLLESMLKTERIPSDLRRFVHDKAEGNPFYLEELVNSLIESEALVRDNGSWRVTRPIIKSDITSTVHGVISGRLDRLEQETKRILQEASVIGRAFLYEILKRITDLEDQCDRCLGGLERLDLIRARSPQPDLEYAFKHALTQEVVYNGLLKKDRQEIHERIGLVMEELFQDRLPEFYETLAFHFKQGKSLNKSIDYLVKSGEKSLKKYGLEESDQYFREAYDLLSDKGSRTKEEAGLLIDVLFRWAYVFYYRGDFKALVDLLSAHEKMAESLDDSARLGMFYAWLGFGLFCRERIRDSYEYLHKSLQIGEEIGNHRIIGYACTWLTYPSLELGLIDEAIHFGERAKKISEILRRDQYLYFKTLGSLTIVYLLRGDKRAAFRTGQALSDYGSAHANIRSMVLGHIATGAGYLIDGDYTEAIKSFQRAIQIAADPLYSVFSKVWLGYTYIYNNSFVEAEETLNEVLTYTRGTGAELWGTMAYSALGVLSIADGDMDKGMKMLKEGHAACVKNGRKYLEAMLEYMLGRVYLEIVQKAAPPSMSTMVRNVGFILKNVPFASKKAEDHFNRAIEIAEEMGATGMMSYIYLDLGYLHKAKGRTHQAKEFILEAIKLFEQCEAEVFLKQAKEALASLM